MAGGYGRAVPAVDRPRKAVPAEVAAIICGCSPAEVHRYRKEVLPRPAGLAHDLEAFSAQEVVAMAAGTVARKWHIRAHLDRLVASLALRDSTDRTWLVVYESRRGLRVEPAPFSLSLVGSKRAAVFDPARYYEAFDTAVGGEGTS